MKIATQDLIGPALDYHPGVTSMTTLQENVAAARAALQAADAECQRLRRARSERAETLDAEIIRPARAETVAWLLRYTHLTVADVDSGMRMRREGDYTPDEDLKAGWLADMNAIDRARLVAVFDDRARVVRMWRARGVACFQVAEGEF